MKLILNILISFLLIFDFAACNGKAGDETGSISVENAVEQTADETPQKTEINWTGVYTYEEEGGPGLGGEPRISIYTLNIKNKGEKFIADYNVDGYQTMVRYKAEGKNKDGKLELYLTSTGEDHIGAPAEKGELPGTLEKAEEGKYLLKQGDAEYTMNKEK